jgi:copper oxidase (laccase) domain-containing protein
MIENRKEKEFKRLGDAEIHATESGFKYAKYDALFNKRIKSVFSYGVENMSFGAEKDSTGRVRLVENMRVLTTNLGLSAENQVVMTPNINKPQGRFLFISKEKEIRSLPKNTSQLAFHDLPSILSEYPDDNVSADKTRFYPKYAGPQFESDGMFTDSTDLTLEIPARDCVVAVITSTDSKKPLTGIVHGGRQQIEGELAYRMIEACQNLWNVNPGDLVIGIGPHICPKHYSFDRQNMSSDLKSQFNFDESNWAGFIDESSPGIFTLGIGGLFKQQLLKAGVQLDNIFESNVCTYESQDQGNVMASYRYQKQHNLPPSRMITITGLLQDQ